MRCIDFHTHTNESDGFLSPKELLDYAINHGLDLIAITDHDTFKAVEYLRNTTIVEKDSIDIITGIELTGDLENKHVLGYWRNGSTYNKTIYDFIEDKMLMKYQVVDYLLADLRHYGINVNLETIFGADSNRKRISRVAIAEYLVDNGYSETVEEAYNKYVGKYELPGYFATPEESIKAIIRAGGVPILAHPYASKLPWADTFNWINNLVRVGLAGLEVSHPKHTEDEKERLIWMCDKYDLMCSGGSDFHGKDRIEIGKGTNSEKIERKNYLKLLDYLNY